MEEEIRFYFKEEEYENLLNKMKNIGNTEGLKYEGCYLELTVQYDHPAEENTFYSKEIDGRFRLRSSINIETNEEKSKVSWKRRLPEKKEKDINIEEEIEVELKEGQLENLQLLLETIVRMKRVESYQRYRNVFCNDEVEIVVDKYPFGIALEIENKSKTKNGEEVIKKWLNILNLNIQESFKLSWDDKYTSLCKAQGIEPVKDVIFDDSITMPKVLGKNKIMNEIYKYYKNTKNALPHENIKKFLEIDILPGNAIELGCGAGRDTICLIKNGWNVLAIDREDTKGLIEEKINENELEKLRFSVQNFENIKLEKNNLIVSNYSIPFCGKKYFKEFWNKIEESIEKGRIFCWQLFWSKRSMDKNKT